MCLTPKSPQNTVKWFAENAGPPSLRMTHGIPIIAAHLLSLLETAIEVLLGRVSSIKKQLTLSTQGSLSSRLTEHWCSTFLQAQRRGVLLGVLGDFLSCSFSSSCKPHIGLLVFELLGALRANNNTFLFVGTLSQGSCVPGGQSL